MNSGAVINTRGKQETISNVSGKEYVAESDYNGNSRITSSAGISEFSSNNYQSNILMDRFETIGNNDNQYVKGIKEERIEGDVYVIVGSTNAIQTDAYTRWAEVYSKFVAVNILPDTTKPVVPIIPGVDLTEV